MRYHALKKIIDDKKLFDENLNLLIENLKKEFKNIDFKIEKVENFNNYKDIYIKFDVQKFFNEKKLNLFFNYLDQIKLKSNYKRQIKYDFDNRIMVHVDLLDNYEKILERIGYIKLTFPLKSKAFLCPHNVLYFPFYIIERYKFDSSNKRIYFNSFKNLQNLIIDILNNFSQIFIDPFINILRIFDLLSELSFDLTFEIKPRSVFVSRLNDFQDLPYLDTKLKLSKEFEYGENFRYITEVFLTFESVLNTCEYYKKSINIRRHYKIQHVPQLYSLMIKFLKYSKAKKNIDYHFLLFFFKKELINEENQKKKFNVKNLFI